MKGILVIIDGLGDLPHKALKNKTPLEAAEKPNLDYLASHGRLGYMYSVKKGQIPSTSEAIISMFGEKWQDYPRGWLEALGAGIELTRGDLALRANFATIDNLKKRRIIDRRAGRTLTTKEAKILAKDLRKIELPCRFIFKPTLQHRAVLVFKGGFSDNITCVDPACYSKNSNEKSKLKFSVPEDDDEESKFSANILNNFIEKSFLILSHHTINRQREKKGFYPANIILARAPGVSIKKIKKFEKWACTTSVPVMKGICKCLGINLFGFKDFDLKNYDIYRNLKKNLALEIKKSIKLIKKKGKKFKYFLIYLKETDVAGHDNKPFEKKEMIELIDKKLFSFLRRLSIKKNIKIAVTADHSTPCKIKAHTEDPVPLLLFEPKKAIEEKNQTFCEKDAKKGELKKVLGKELLKKIKFI